MKRRREREEKRIEEKRKLAICTAESPVDPNDDDEDSEQVADSPTERREEEGKFS